MALKKILIMDHNCAFPQKQRIYVKLMEKFSFDVSIIAPATWKDPYGAGQIVPTRLPEFLGTFLPTPVAFPGKVPRHFYKADLRRIISSADPDLIYGYHDYYMLASCQLFASNRLSRQAPIGFYASQNIDKSFSFPISRTERSVLRGSDFLFPISEEAAAVARSKGFAGASLYQPLFVDTDLFSPGQPEPGLRARLGIAEGAFIVGFAGRLVEEKGLDILVAAAARLADVHVVLIGQGPAKEALADLARTSGLGGRVHFLPSASQAELGPLLTECDVVAVPSLTRPGWKEQFGRLILEALACGTPVIGSSSGAIPEVIDSTGGGLVAKEGDSEALAAAILRIRDEPGLRAEFERTGRARTLQLYSLDAYVERMGGHFLSIMDGRRAAA